MIRKKACNGAQIFATKNLLNQLPSLLASPWWPWVRNYDGEISIDDGTIGGLVPYLWIDQNLKKSMGF